MRGRRKDENTGMDFRNNCRTFNACRVHQLSGTRLAFSCIEYSFLFPCSKCLLTIHNSLLSVSKDREEIDICFYMPIKGILFDLDGVIVDTLHYHFLAWQEMFHRKGGEVKDLTVLLHEGRSSIEILPILIKESGIQIPKKNWHNFIEQKRKYYRSIVKIRFYPDALDTVRKLRKLGIKCALVTACAKKNMEKALTPEQRSLFNIIVTGDDIPRAKPNPDPYEIARKSLGLRKEECLVIENAPLGIQSAKAAGIRCAVIATTLPKRYLKGADIYLDSLSDILNYLS